MTADRAGERCTALVARALSIAGHPALLMPLAVAGAGVVHGAPPAVWQAAAGATLGLALVVGGFGLWQVRAGRWRHVDASRPQERRQLNALLVLLLFAAAAVLAALEQPPAVAAALALALGGGMVVVAQLLSHWLKLSLHVAFALFATSLLWPAAWAVGPGLALTAGVAWSRLALRRHTRAEVALGLLAGAVAGGGLQLLR